MGQYLEGKGLIIDGAKNRSEIYTLLSAAQIKFALATRATALPSLNSDEGIEAGYAIFRSTYDAISHNRWEGHLPSFYEIPDTSPLERELKKIGKPPIGLLHHP